jgi:ATP-dependent helicase HrpB
LDSNFVAIAVVLPSLPVRLPIDDVLPQLLAALREHAAVVLQAPTGAGKTTRVPPAVWQAGLAGEKQVVVLQPRRLAARATAARMASERGSQLGDEIGYQVRFEKRSSRRTRVLVVTEGILLRRMQDDPFLDDVGVVIFDEFHERNLNSELALGMVRKIQQSVRPDLKIIVMSATLAAESIAEYFQRCPVIVSQGRLHPVAVEYAALLDRQPLAESVAHAVEALLHKTPGDVLVFLPGVGEIRQAQRELESLARVRDFVLCELYGDLPPEQQDAVLLPGLQRKVILSTNVAETSITIEGVTGVVDSGLARVLRFDPHVGVDKLQVESISQAAADQRAGRAGRTAPGVCMRLWPEAAQRHRPPFDEPEIRRLDLAGPVLQLKAWIEPELEDFPWFEPPRPAALAQAISLLERLDALADGAVTDLGRALARLPTHPRVARLLVEGAARGCLREAALAAALLTERDPFVRMPSSGRRREASYHARSDVAERVAALEAFADTGQLETPHGALHRAGAKNVLRVADQLMRQVDARTSSSREEEPLLRALLAAFPDRLARRREPGSRRAVMVGGKGVHLASESVLGESEPLFLCVDVAGEQSEALVRQASAVDLEWLPKSHLRTVVEVDYDEAQDRLQARRRSYWETLLLDEVPASLPNPESTASALATIARERWDCVFPLANEDDMSFILRARSLAAWMPQLELPAVDDESLQKLLPLVAYNCRSLAELKRGPWLMYVKNLFTHAQLQTIDREAPEKITVPSGSQIRLDYQPGKPPVLAVRIQEVFGLLETPCIAGGRVRVLLHLLAPNMRPQQVTDDLRSFWTNTYPQVRKDLRARYPKHSWPEDPWTAVAQRKPQRR